MLKKKKRMACCLANLSHNQVNVYSLAPLGHPGDTGDPHTEGQDGGSEEGKYD